MSVGGGGVCGGRCVGGGVCVCVCVWGGGHWIGNTRNFCALIQQHMRLLPGLPHALCHSCGGQYNVPMTHLSIIGGRDLLRKI